MPTQIKKVSVDPKKITHSLAFDVASQLLDQKAILEKYELTATELRHIVRSNEFKKLYQEAKLAWESDPKARIRAKAAAAVEDALIPVHTILHDGQVNPSARLEAFKQMKELADLQPKKDSGLVGGAVQITINVPEKAEPTVINATALEHTDEEKDQA